MRATFTAIGVATAMSVLITPSMAQALTATSSTIGVSLPVNSPNCTVSNNNSSINLPAASVGQSVGSYQALNLTTSPASAPGATDTFTSTSLNQTATISCSIANTPISSISIQPGPAAFTGSPTPVSYQFLVDTSSPPVKAGGGAGGVMNFQAEQISTNGNAAAFVYGAPSTSAITPYTVQFSTGALTGSPSASVATIVWRPIFYTGVNSQNKFTTPTGGSYNGSFQIVVNY